MLCHKPAQLEAVASEIAGAVSAVASVVGGTSVAGLRTAYPSASVFRLMPNTPVEVRRGVVCYARDPEVDPGLEREVIALFDRVATVVPVTEAQMGPAGAVMSVGPAYLALVAEAQVDAAVRHGLPAALAGRLAAETMAGTAELLQARDYDTLAVRREVTSPGGITARGLDALERGGLRGAFQAAMDRVCGAQP